MTVHLRAHSVSLELPLDLQRLESGARLSSFKATLGGDERLYRKVLKGIHFTAGEGDRIGVLGLNGAGKTTLLRVLNGAFPPTQGRVERRGTTQSLLNATLGFAEHASLIENVVLRGTAMGLRRRQLDQALPEILEFAGLGDRATHRLHTLSSGQRMRLGFAISTAIQPDILLMDEWIATGDAAFIQQAQKRLRARLNDSRIVVLASHNTALLREMCTKALVIDEGRMSFFGDITDGLEAYREIVARAGNQASAALAESDPLLFGETSGNIEQIRVEGTRIEVEGWVADKAGAPVSLLCLELGGERRVIEQFERVERPDVRRHLGKKRSDYGFRIVVERFEGDVEAAAMQLQVRGGADADRLGMPLPLTREARLDIERAEFG